MQVVRLFAIAGLLGLGKSFVAPSRWKRSANVRKQYSSPMSTNRNGAQTPKTGNKSIMVSSVPVKQIVQWLRDNGVTDFAEKRSQPGSFVNTGISINLKGGYILSILTDPNVTFGQYAETGILKDGNLIVDKKLDLDGVGDCIQRHDSHEEVVEHIKKVMAVADAGQFENCRDHNF